MASSSLDEVALVEAIRAAAPGVSAVILAGSWARGAADASSDVDLVVVWSAPHRALQVGSWDGRLVEAIYLPAHSLADEPVHRATLSGARPLYDPDGIARGWLEAVRRRLAHPPAWAAELGYSRFELAQALKTMEWTALRDPDTLVLLRGHFVTALMAYRFRQRRLWAPTLRRQLPRIASEEPDLYPLLTACLRAQQPQDIVDRCREAWTALAGDGGTALAPFTSSPPWPLQGSG